MLAPKNPTELNRKIAIPFASVALKVNNIEVVQMSATFKIMKKIARNKKRNLCFILSISQDSRTLRHL